MNQTEKRRKKLLEETRKRYSDRGNIPAIHPRYKCTYNQLYPNESDMVKGNLGIRCIICVLIFAAYIAMGMKEYTFLGMNDTQVQKQIMQNYM